MSSSSVMSILESEYILSPKATKAKRRRIKQALRAKKEATTSKKELSQIQANLLAVEDAHSRRPRCAYFDKLLQMYATPYEWVSGQIWHLHLAIDDASGVVTGALFDTQETLNGYYHVFEQILTDYGIPYKFLTDKRTVFTYKKKGALSDDKDTYTQFAYACKQLGTQLESSSVPQAKGRIERLNQTLQSRLPIEFRLAGVTDIHKANEFIYHYIKEFNEKFSLPLYGIKSVFETQPSKEKINLTLAVLTERTVDAGHAIQFEKKFYKMIDNKGLQTHYRKGTKVMLIKAFDKSMFACVNDKDIYALEEIPAHEHKSKDLDADYKQPKPRKPYIPPMNHPWRLDAFNKFAHSQPHRIEEDIKSA
nr:ISNCY family transposase [Lachnoanaerobaculum umeaense]